MFSVNAINQKRYTLPKNLDDSKVLEEFLEKNSSKKVVAVQGLGFVGAVMSLVCANALTEEYAVIGVDLADEANYWKIQSINEGTFPLVADDPKIETFYQNTREKENFLATYDPLAYQFADIVIVDVNLDVQKEAGLNRELTDFDVELSKFKAAITTIAKNCRDDVLVLVETTVPPGTCEKIVRPIIEMELEKRGLQCDKFKLGHSYERVMPGPEYIDSIRCFPRVYAGMDDTSSQAVESFLSTIIDTEACELTRLEHTNATELAKVLENSYRATNIAFVVEWSRFAEEAGVDLYAVVDAIRVRETHSNLMYPGVGVGGYCLTKDPLLASWARRNLFDAESDLSMSVSSVSVNDQMPIYAFNRMVELFGSFADQLVVFLGVSYRGDLGDTRFTPVQALVNSVRDQGATIKLHDPFVSYWQEESCEVESNLDVVLEPAPDIVIISAGHSVYSSDRTIANLMNMEPAKIFDSIGLFSRDQLNELQARHRVSVLGRGDIQ